MKDSWTVVLRYYFQEKLMISESNRFLYRANRFRQPRRQSVAARANFRRTRVLWWLAFPPTASENGWPFVPKPIVRFPSRSASAPLRSLRSLRSASPAAAGENPTEAHQRRADEPTEDGPSSWRRVRAHGGGPELMKEGPELWSGLEARSGTDRRSLICFASNELGPVF